MEKSFANSSWPYVFILRNLASAPYLVFCFVCCCLFFFMVKPLSSLCILDSNPLSDEELAKILSPVCELSEAIVSFVVQKPFNFVTS